jgi:hypothetical protein
MNLYLRSLSLGSQSARRSIGPSYWTSMADGSKWVNSTVRYWRMTDGSKWVTSTVRYWRMTDGSKWVTSTVRYWYWTIMTDGSKWVTSTVRYWTGLSMRLHT